MDSILIQGGRPLRGTLSVQGCKNALLPLMAAAAAIPGQSILTGCPPIRDETVTLALLEGLGVSTAAERDRLVLDASRDGGTAPDPTLAGQLRSSVLFLGALLGRYGHAEVPLPGGCVLGKRPLDLHLAGLEALGVQSFCDGGILHCKGRPRGGHYHLPYPSVGATENLILAALGAEEPVWITGAAREPEIEDLVNFLTASGARISGGGSSRVHIIPAPLHGTSYRVLPDRMEAATWLCAAACTGGSLTLTGLCPDHLRPVLRALRAAGCEITEGEASLRICAGDLHSPGSVRTAPYPGFPTDAQAPVMAALLRAEGITRFEETVFDDRFRHIPALQAMGARIACSGSAALVTGVRELHGARVAATDLRGAAAMVCAALGARGESEITQAWHLDRGYGNFVQRLRRLGAVALAR